MLPFQFADQVKDDPRGDVIVAALDDYASNVLEDYHASIEASFIPTLERAWNGDEGFYTDDQECIPFLNYLSTQYMRTRGIKERAQKSAVLGARMEHRDPHVRDRHLSQFICSTQETDADRRQ
jgi:hypothetical protein